MKNCIPTIVLLIILSPNLLLAQLTQLWSTNYNGILNMTDGGKVVAVDKYGNVFAGGTMDGNINGGDYGLIKYNGSTGAILWTARYSGTGGGEDWITDILVDTTGNVIVTGFCEQSNANGIYSDPADIVTIKYNGSTGAIIWTAVYNGPANGDDQTFTHFYKFNVLNHLVADNNGNVWIAGKSEGAAGNTDFLVLQYNGGNGTLLWQDRYDGGGAAGDIATAITVGPSRQEIFVTGYYNSGTATGYGFCTRKYRSNGTFIWMATGKTSCSIIAYAVTVDNAGDVYVTGQGGAFSQAGITVEKYRGSDGFRLWNKPFIYCGQGDDFGTALRVDNAGYLYMAGTAVHPNAGCASHDYLLMKLNSATGVQLWEMSFDQGNWRDDAVFEMEMENGRYLYLMGDGGYLLKYDTSGVEIFSQAIPISMQNHMTLANGSVYITGYTGTYPGYDITTMRYSSPATPVTLISFTAFSMSDETVELTWSTSSEMNNDYFKIERSRNGNDWEEAGVVPGNSDTRTEQSYSFTDKKPHSGTTYYRLKQVDKNGEFSYSSIVEVFVAIKGNFQVGEIYPNPVVNSCTLNVNCCTEGNILVEMMDMLGKTVRKADYYLKEGDNKITMDVQGIPAGSYVVRLTAGDRLIMRKVVKTPALNP